MTDFFGTQATLTTPSQTSPIQNAEPNDLQGRVRIFFDTYVIPAASPPAAADTIFMGGGTLPKGARVIDGWIGASADISDGTCLIGVEVVTDAGTTILINAFDADAAAAFTRVTVADIATVGFVLDSEGTVQLNPTGDVNTAAAVITVCLLYVID